VNAADQRALGADLLNIIRRDRARRSRRAQIGKFFGKFFESLLIGFLIALLQGWLFMLAVGVVHAHWIPQVPTIGFWWSVLIWTLLPSTATRASAGSERAK
jgi:hypothetical protein